VRLDLGLYDSESLEPVAKGITVTGNRDSLGALTDSVVLALLQQVWQQDDAPSPSLTAVTTRSIPALRAFLDGERLFEQGDMGGAMLAYGSAMAADSSFVLAYFRHALSGSMWEGLHVDPEALEALRRGVDKLPERERLIARAFIVDSLEVKVALLREVTRTFPGHWPGWFELGDVIIHGGPLAGYDWTEGLRAFRRAVEINPRFITGWEHIFSYANGRLEPLADSAFARLSKLGWDATREPYFQLTHGLGRSGGVIVPELSGLADSLVQQFATVPDQFGDRYGSFSMGFLWQGFPAAQVELNRRRLAKASGDRDIVLQMGSAWAWAARGSWDSAQMIMARLAELNPGTYVPRRAARFGDPVLAVESYGVAVLAAWLGATDPEAADQRRPLALKAIGPLPDEGARAEARARVAWFDGLLGLTRGDRRAVALARRDAMQSGFAQSANVEGSLAAFDRALRGDRTGAGRALAALEWRCLAREDCSHYTPEIGVQRLLAAQWLQAGGEIEEAVRLLRWQDARHEVFAGTPGTLGKTLWGPTFLTRAQLEETRGERRRAAEYYQQFVRFYDQPMPSQVHLVNQAKEAWARLGEGP
jgi:hypothetical protein